jgi:hypothetical protein
VAEALAVYVDLGISGGMASELASLEEHNRQQTDRPVPIEYRRIPTWKWPP